VKNYIATITINRVKESDNKQKIKENRKQKIINIREHKIINRKHSAAKTTSNQIMETENREQWKTTESIKRQN